MSAHPDKVREFLDAFEEVFDRDWAHTKEMLGIRDETEAQKAEAAKLGLETIPIIAEDGSFVHPRLRTSLRIGGVGHDCWRRIEHSGRRCHDAYH